MGAGDLGVGRRVKAMATAFYGRIAAYEKGLADSNGALAEALLRNVFRGEAEKEAAARRLASYIDAQVSGLQRQTLDTLLEGKVTFADSLPAA